MLTWMIMIVPGVALHVGNFPDVPSCLSAAQQARVSPGPGAAPQVNFICVAPSTGKPGDPVAP